MRSELNTHGLPDVGTGSTKAEVERALPGWCAERRRLDRDRIRQRDTTGGDRLVVEFIRTVGPGVAAGMGVLAGWAAYSRFGLSVGLAAGVVVAAIAFGAASYAVVLTRTRFARAEHARRDAVARIESSIRELDGNISRAFLEHGLVDHIRFRASY